MKTVRLYLGTVVAGFIFMEFVRLLFRTPSEVYVGSAIALAGVTVAWVFCGRIGRKSCSGN